MSALGYKRITLENEKKCFWLVFVITLAIKLLISAYFPMLGDEVYWIQPIAWGYYDHPPMVAWILSSISLISTSPIFLRLPQQLASVLIVFLIIVLMKNIEARKAYLAGILMLVSPGYLLNIFILPDSFLILFSFLMVYTTFFAIRRQSHLLYALAGVFLGAAFLSKYLIFPIFMGLAVGYFMTGKENIRFSFITTFVLAATPFFIENILWNMHHNWINIVFNLNLRIEKFQPIKALLSYFISILILFSPPALFCFYKNFHSIIKYFIELRKSAIIIFLSCLIVPLIFYFLLSIKKGFGLHWLFPISIFFILVLAIAINRKKIKKLILTLSVYTAFLLLAPLVIFAVMPSKMHKYAEILYSFKIKSVIEKLEPYYKNHFIIGASSYSKSAELGYLNHWRVITFAKIGIHGRNDDFNINYEQLNNRNFTLLSWNGCDISKYKPYFQSFKVMKYQIDDIPYCFFIGYSFKYLKYREDILKVIWETYYLPGLKLPFSHDFFGQKYHFS